jgi:hypothetical protein
MITSHVMEHTLRSQTASNPLLAGFKQVWLDSVHELITMSLTRFKQDFNLLLTEFKLDGGQHYPGLNRS